MRGRLIKDNKGDIVFLCHNGTLVSATNELCYNLLRDFKSIDKKAWLSDEQWLSPAIPDMALYPGETLAFISDEYQLIVMDSSPFMDLVDIKYVRDLENYISVNEYAKNHDKSREICKLYCRNGRIPGALLVGKNWMVPADAPYPVPVERQREGVRGPRGPRQPKKKDKAE